MKSQLDWGEMAMEAGVSSQPQKTTTNNTNPFLAPPGQALGANNDYLGNLINESHINWVNQPIADSLAKPTTLEIGRAKELNFNDPSSINVEHKINQHLDALAELSKDVEAASNTLVFMPAPKILIPVEGQSQVVQDARIEKPNIVVPRLASLAENSLNHTINTVQTTHKASREVWGAIKELFSNFILFKYESPEQKKAKAEKRKQEAKNSAERKSFFDRLKGVISELFVNRTKEQQTIQQNEEILGMSVADKNKSMSGARGNLRNLSNTDIESVYFYKQISRGVKEQQMVNERAEKAAQMQAAKGTSKGSGFTNAQDNRADEARFASAKYAAG